MAAKKDVETLWAGAAQLLHTDFIAAAMPGDPSSWSTWATLSAAQSGELSAALSSSEAANALQLLRDCYTYAEEHETLQVADASGVSPERIRGLVGNLHSLLLEPESLQAAIKPALWGSSALAKPATIECNATTQILAGVSLTPSLLSHSIAVSTLRALASHHALSFTGSRSFAWEQRALLPPAVAVIMLNVAAAVGSAHACLVANAVLRSQLPLHPTRCRQHASVAALRMSLLQRAAAQGDPVGCYLLAQMYQQETLGVQRHSEVPQLLELASAGGVAAAAAYKAYVHLMHAHGQQGGAKAHAEAAAAMRALLALSQAGSAEASLHYLMAVAYGVGSMLQPNKEAATIVWQAAKAALPQDRFVTLGCRTVLDGVVDAPDGFQPEVVLTAAAAKGHDGALAVLLQAKGEHALQRIAPLVQEAGALGLTPLECAAAWCHQRETLVQAWAAASDHAEGAMAGFATAALHRTVAIRELAKRVHRGHGCAQDDARAETLFRTAAKRGDMQAIVALGEIAAQHHLVTGEARFAVSAQSLLSKTASAGSEAALRLLGLLQFYGRCDLPKSLESAFEFAQALRASHADGKIAPQAAGVDLLSWTHAVFGARLLQGGGGLAMDPAGARAEFEKGCLKHDLYCMYHLAFMLERGQGGVADFARASTLYSKTRELANQHTVSGQTVHDPPLQDIVTGCDSGIRRCREASDAAWWRKVGIGAALSAGAMGVAWLLLRSEQDGEITTKEPRKESQRP